MPDINTISAQAPNEEVKIEKVPSYLTPREWAFAKNHMAAFKEHILLIDWCHAVICPLCGKKVIDVDKTRGQRNLDTKCPSCGKNPVEVARNKARQERPSKHEMKRQRKEEKRQRKAAQREGGK